MSNLVLYAIKGLLLLFLCTLRETQVGAFYRLAE